MTPADLKAWRERMGWSQERMAKALDVHPMTVSKWERGTQEPEHPAMLVLALGRLEQKRD